MEQFLTVREVAGLTRLAQSTIYALIAQQAIPHFKLGARVVFKPGEIDEWLESKRQPVQPISPQS